MASARDSSLISRRQHLSRRPKAPFSLGHCGWKFTCLSVRKGRSSRGEGPHRGSQQTAFISGCLGGRQGEATLERAQREKCRVRAVESIRERKRSGPGSMHSPQNAPTGGLDRVRRVLFGGALGARNPCEERTRNQPNHQGEPRLGSITQAEQAEQWSPGA
jgi:hypothetical protein